jgi:hypothetical protein
MEPAILLLIVACIAAGVSGAIAVTWGLRREVLSLKYELADLQNKVLREVKARAGEMGRAKRDVVAEAADLLKRRDLEPSIPGTNPWAP